MLALTAVAGLVTCCSPPMGGPRRLDTLAVPGGPYKVGRTTYIWSG